MHLENASSEAVANAALVSAQSVAVPVPVPMATKAAPRAESHGAEALRPSDAVHEAREMEILGLSGTIAPMVTCSWKFDGT